jgi:BirA family transcriptional regulator, biotin operon repressor / biotin---[acetyl-CoA-carboxylase] ligase
MSAPLDPVQLRRALGDCTLGREIVVLEETTSTNDSVLERASPDLPEGLVIFAEHQTAGRGQRSNRWESARRMGLWFSILLRPKIDIGQSPRLTAWAAEIVAETIRTEFGLSPAIKSPNDVQIDGRKVAGVLVEMRAQANARHVAIAGIGVNVSHVREDFSEELRERAISLAMALNREVDRDKLAIALLHNLDRSYPGVATVRIG